ncbi:MAG: hypothetical protein AAF988_06685 [Pseudomonadota bacterium]
MQIITLNNCPSNIVIFEAEGFDEAMQRASVAMEQDNIQGAVWHDPSFVKEPYDVSDWFDPKYLRNQSPFSYEMRISQKRGENLDVKPSGGLPYSFSDTGLLEQRCMESFNKIAPYIRKNGTAIFALNKTARGPEIHIDEFHSNPNIPSANHGLFDQKPIRLVKAWRGAGTILIDPVDESPDNLLALRKLGFGYGSPATIANPWQVAVGDTLFIADNTWGEEKALLHGEPEWIGYDEDANPTKFYDNPRIVEILTIS